VSGLDPSSTALKAVRERLAGAVVALDYDGTLAPVVDDPASAHPQVGAVAALTVLAPLVRTLAVVTGRPADTVVALGGLEAVPELTVLGQYGAQRWHAGQLEGAPPLPGVAEVRAGLPEVLETAGHPGAWVEDKDISLVVHLRRTSDPERAQAALLAPVRELGERHGLEVHEGRHVLELRPPGYDKGAALLSLCDPAPTAVVFAGDDAGDLPAFAAVEQLRAGGCAGLLVASDSPECPPQLSAGADLVVDGPAGVLAVLVELAAGAQPA